MQRYSCCSQKPQSVNATAYEERHQRNNNSNIPYLYVNLKSHLKPDKLLHDCREKHRNKHYHEAENKIKRPVRNLKNRALVIESHNKTQRQNENENSCEFCPCNRVSPELVPQIIDAVHILLWISFVFKYIAWHIFSA